MPDTRSVTTRLTMDASGYIAGAEQAVAASRRLGDALAAAASQKVGDTAAKTIGDQSEKAAPKVKSLGQELHDAAASPAFDKVANGLLGVGAAAVGGAGLAVKAYADFDKEMSNVIATGDDARKNQQALRDAAVKAGVDTKYSAVEAAGGMTELARAGMKSADILGGGLAGALNLAAAGKLDVAKSGELVASTMAQFSLNGEKASHVADLLAAGANEAVGDVGDLGYALKMSGTVAHEYGISIEDTTTTLALFAKNALLGSDGGTSFKQMLLQLAQPTKQQQKVMDELGISFYNAQGRFIGMRDMTGMLSEKMRGLSQEQQNAALKTLFGADAIRAANILVKEGVNGYDQMAKAVNRDGYAKQLAAEKTNNLAGDVERLKSTFEAAAIKAGEGANGPLRDVVKWLEQTVEWASRLPAPVQQGGVLIAGVGGASLVAAGGVMKFASSAVETYDALTKLREAAPRASSAMEGLGKAGVGLAAVAATITVIASQSNEMSKSGVQGIEAYRAQLLGIGKDAATSKPLLEDIFHTASGQQMVRDVNGLGDAFKRLTYTLHDGGAAFDKADDWLNKNVWGMFGARSEAQKLTDQFGQMDQALTRMNPDQAATAFQSIQKAATAAHFPLDQLRDLFPQYRDELLKTANDVNVHNLSAQEMVDWMGGKVPPAVTAAQQAQAGMQQQTQATTDAVKKQADTIGALTQAQLDHANAAIGLMGATSSWRAAVDSTNEAIAKNKQNLDLGTEAGRANQGALDKLAESALAMMKAQHALNGTTEETKLSQYEAGEAFVAAAQKMGMSEEQARKLADWYGLQLPPAVAATVAGQANLRDKTEILTGSLKDQVKTVEELRDEHMKAANQQLALSGSQVGFQAALAAATDGLKKHAAGLNIATEAGRDNRKALDEIASSALAVIQKQTDLKVSSTEIAGFTRGAGDAFVDTAKKMGMSEDAARALADRYGLVPHEVHTDVTTAADLSGVQAAERNLQAISGRTVTATVATQADLSGVAAATASLNAVAGRTVYTYVVSKQIGNAASFGGLSSRAYAMAEAEGGVVEYYARGGLRREQHVAQIAPAGAMRVWAEPETGGEAYIPLAPAKRARSVDIWRETGRRLGQLMFADGGFYNHTPDAPAAGGTTINLNVTNPVAERTSETIRAASSMVKTAAGW